jgi:DsbC/DsbD-like thiol-disulfide interchange protein
MKKILMLALILGLFITKKAGAQILTPVKWSYGAKETSPTEAVVFLKATIDEGWHVYSQLIKEGGPIKTTFTFNPAADYLLIGKTLEPKPITRMEKVFDMEVGFFENTVVFQQKIKLKKGQATIKGKLEYMTCNDKQCLPPATEEFSMPVK